MTFEDVDHGVVVVHGCSRLSGEDELYDGAATSPLDENLPLEATIPVRCGQL